ATNYAVGDTADAAVGFDDNPVHDVAIGDLNGGGNDLVVSNRESGTVSVLLQLPSNPGSFANKANYSAGGRPVSIAVGNLNGDSQPDVVVTNQLDLCRSEAFVTKLDPTGTTVVYSTFLGGADDDVGSGIAVDGSGNAYVVGTTYSNDFPHTSGA